MSKYADQEKTTVCAFEAETIEAQFILCLRHRHVPMPPPQKNIPMRENVTDIERRRRRRRTRKREREKASSLCSSASENQLYYITVSGLGSSHAFKEEAHVPLHLKSHGRVGEDGDGDGVEAGEQRRKEKSEEKQQNTDDS